MANELALLNEVQIWFHRVAMCSEMQTTEELAVPWI